MRNCIDLIFGFRLAEHPEWPFPKWGPEILIYLLAQYTVNGYVVCNEKSFSKKTQEKEIFIQNWYVFIIA